MVMRFTEWLPADGVLAIALGLWIVVAGIATIAAGVYLVRQGL